MNYIFKIALGCCVLLGALTGCNNRSIKLQLKYEKGFEKKIYIVTEMSYGDRISKSSTMVLKLKLDSVMVNSYRFIVDVNSITFFSSNGNELEDYDSNEPESEMTKDEKAKHAKFNDMSASEFFIEIDQQGRVIKPFYYKNGNPYKGTHSYWDEIIEMPTLQIVFPDHDIEIGDQWKYETLVAYTKQKKEFTYTLKEVNDKEVIIELYIETIGMVSGFSKPVLKGTCRLDRKTNQLIKADMKSNMASDGEMSSFTIE